MFFSQKEKEFRMNMYFSKVVISLLFFWIPTILCMDQKQALVPMNIGLFDTLPQELKKIIFTSLKPECVNRLRKSCKEFSTLFSFCSPSAEFISYKNTSIYQKDLKRIFFTAAYDGNHAIVESLGVDCTQDHCYPIEGSLSGLLLSKTHQGFEFKEGRGCDLDGRDREHGVCYRHIAPSPLLIACISGNTERVKKIIIDEDEDLISSISSYLKSYFVPQASHFLFVVIDNRDTQMLELFIKDKKILQYIKTYGHALLQRAFFIHSKAIVQIFIENKCCNLNDKKTDEFPGWSRIGIKAGFKDPRFNSTVLDVLERNCKQWNEYESVRNMLIAGGAKTSKEL